MSDTPLSKVDTKPSTAHRTFWHSCKAHKADTQKPTLQKSQNFPTLHANRTFVTMDKLTPEQRRKNMQAVKAKGSVIEVTLAKALWKKGYRYCKNDKSVFGKPDLTFKKLKIAVFVDSEFWHGKNWDKRRHDHKSNQDFWQTKIEKNIQRDKIVNKTLKSEGWTVIRIWGKEIKNNTASCVLKIQEAINTKYQNALYKKSN